MKRKLTLKERIILTEIYRRLNYLGKGDLNHAILLSLPLYASRIKRINIT